MSTNAHNPFYEPIVEEDLAKVAKLVSGGADVNNPNSLPLHLAVSKQRRTIAAYLISKGASTESRDSNGFTALHTAAFQIESDMTDLLISAGADVEARDNYGNTPIIIAASLGRIGPIRSLIIAGADLSAKDAEGRTPRDLARAFSYRMAEGLLTGRHESFVRRWSATRSQPADDDRAP